MARRATSLGPKPSLFSGFCFLLVVFMIFVVFLFVFCCFCFFGGFKGQVRWPKGPPHLGPKPSLSFCFCFFFFFSSLPCLSFLIGKPCFSPLKRHFFNLSVFPFVSLYLALFGPPPFFPFSFFVSLLFLLFLLHSCFSFLFLVLALSFCFVFCFKMLFCFCFFFFLLVILLCFESSCLISCCFASCFLLLVVFGFCCFHILLCF